jgi:hypothetical protein
MQVEFQSEFFETNRIGIQVSGFMLQTKEAMSFGFKIFYETAITSILNLATCNQSRS